jgi:hypothetical protein
MSHVNQARSNDRHDDGAPEDSRLVIVVFNNDSSPYGATNCLPVAHNTSQPANSPDDVDVDAPVPYICICVPFFRPVRSLTFS